MLKHFFAFAIGLSLLVPQPSVAGAQRPAPTKEQIQQYLKTQADKLHPQHGKITLKDGLITLNLPEDFGYLTPDETEILLHNIWGNPSGSHTDGAIVPTKVSITSRESWGIILNYMDDGYVKDDDAEKIDYNDLLSKMKEQSQKQNEKRHDAGYPPLNLVGWAEEPHYDKASHKLYWARELETPGAPHELNYDIRALGRNGVLVMSIVAGMDQLPMVQKNKDKILSFVEFNPAHRYADFDPSVDKVAAYGMAAMILGFAAAKVGLFKGLFLALLAFKKFVILGALAVVAFFKKLFARK